MSHEQSAESKKQFRSFVLQLKRLNPSWKPKDITNFLIDDAMLALVPFSSFGASNDSVWYRISVGTCSVEEIERIIVNLRTALSQLT